MPHISLAAEKLFFLGETGITNSFVTTYIVMVLLAVGSFIVTKRLTVIPSNRQAIAEIIIGGLYDFFKSVCGSNVGKFFPLLASLFLFIIASNWTGLLPGVGTIGLTSENVAKYTNKIYASETKTINTQLQNQDTTHQSESPQITEESKEHKKNFIPLFRAPTADLNTTIALALVSVVAVQYFGFMSAGLHYSNRFLNFSNPINFFVGILELVSEFSKIISFAFRLFGNIFAGEVLLVVISSLISLPIILPLPFIGMELFVGFIQALVFSMLTAVFLNIAISHGTELHRGEVSAHG